MGFGYHHMYLLRISMSTFYQATQVLRQMGHPQGIPSDVAVFPSGPITIEVKKAVINSWARSFHSVTPEGRSDLLDGYKEWLMATAWANEKRKKVVLIEKIEYDLVESS